jgi:queuine tRNA-ribosyltransferase
MPIKTMQKSSLELTEQWLDRCLKRFAETECPYGHQQTLFPIVQGCIYPDLRKRAAENVASKEADGNAIGGLAVGEPTEKMYEMVELVNEILPKDKPRYLMGVGTPANILEAIERGVDMFDCIMPTRNGRNGQIFTKNGIMNMRNEKWKDDFSPIEKDGASFVDSLTAKLPATIDQCERNNRTANCIHPQSCILYMACKEARKHIIATIFRCGNRK